MVEVETGGEEITDTDTVTTLWLSTQLVEVRQYILAHWQCRVQTETAFF